MKNNEIIKKLPSRANLHTILEERMEDLKRLQTEIGELEDLLYDLDRVDEVFEGVALELWSDNEATSTSDDYPRRAMWYERVGHPGSWTARLYDEHFGSRGEHHCGFPNWTEDEAALVGKRWVAGGPLPEGVR